MKPKLRKFSVNVTQTIEVTLDESKFTEERMEEFRKSFYPFFSIQEHAEHIGQMIVRGVTGGHFDHTAGGVDFIEGYGEPAAEGISVDRWDYFDCDTEVEEIVAPKKRKKRRT